MKELHLRIQRKNISHRLTASNQTASFATHNVPIFPFYDIAEIKLNGFKKKEKKNRIHPFPLLVVAVEI
jgi:hypothetical protein